MRIFLFVFVLLFINGSAFAFEKSEAPVTSGIQGEAYTVSFSDAYEITGADGPGFAITAGPPQMGGESLSVVVTKPYSKTPMPLPGWQQTGSETDITVVYSKPLTPQTTGVISLSARKDVHNIEDENDAAVMLRFKHKF